MVFICEINCMKIKFNNKTLADLERIITQSGYTLRYEKGNFKSGYCILNAKRVVVLNKYYPIEGKINCLIDIIRSVNWEFEQLDEKSQKLYQQLVSQEFEEKGTD